MTGYTVHTGSSEKFSEGWDRIFSGGTKRSKKTTTSKKAVTKKEAGKAAKKPSSKDSK